MNYIAYYLLSICAVLITLTVHEFSHGYAACKLGDPTAKNLGRLTLNPIRHLDPFGALCMVFFHFGWAKPVPINPRYFRHPKRDFAITALAGPLSNLILAFFSAFLYLAFYRILYPVSYPNEFALNLATCLLGFFLVFHQINLGIALFNLIPVPPLDGSRILNVLLPERIYFGIMKYERIIYWVLIGWLFLGGRVAALLLAVPVVAANPVLSALCYVLDLSGMLGDLITCVSGLMFSFWKLLPFLA